MFDGLDSAYPPNAQQAQAALSSGVRSWNGYLATSTGVNLLHPWSRTDFDLVRSVFGVRPIGFCSGLDDPAAVRQLAAEWDVLPLLDVEDGIRADGPWVDGWLATSGAGLYGSPGLHDNHPQPLIARVAAIYPYSGDPVATWPLGKGGPPPPATAYGWQWAGSHDMFGVTVDAGWYDDWFAQGEEDLTPEQDARLSRIEDAAIRVLGLTSRGYQVGADGTEHDADPRWLFDNLDDVHNKVNEIWDDIRVGHHLSNPSFLADLSAKVDAVKAGQGGTDPAVIELLQHIEAGLKAAGLSLQQA